MKKYLLATSAAFILSIGAASAEPDNVYVSVLGGWSFDPHLIYGAAAPAMDSGFNGGARIGVGLDNFLPLKGFSLEEDNFYTQSHYSTLPGAKLGSASFMGDLIYHVPTGTNWGFYGGAGLGVVDDMLHGPAHGAQTVMGWQGLGGIDYAVSPDMTLFTEYRYQNAHDAHIGGLSDVGNTSNNVSVGVKFGM